MTKSELRMSYFEVLHHCRKGKADTGKDVVEWGYGHN